MKVAIWLQGGIGGGNFSQGYPPLLNFVHKISKEHQVTIYSILPANEDFCPNGFLFRTWSKRIKNRRLRAILLCYLFFIDHLKNPYCVINAFWVYPAGTLSVLLGKSLGIPTVVTVQGGEAAAIKEIRYGNMLPLWLRKITLWTCENATTLNTISQFLVDQLRYHGLRREDSVIIPFGAEVSRFTFSSKILGPSLRLIHVANLTEVKDQVTLLKAFSIIHSNIPSELHIIGADYLNGSIHRQAENLGLINAIKFLGPISQSQLPQHYAWADIMLHTSLHEGQSGVVVEAMASGVVVCATPVGIVYDLNTSYFKTAPIQDFVSLAREVINLWNNPSMYYDLREKAFTWAKEHDADWTAFEFKKLYQSLCKNK